MRFQPSNPAPVEEDISFLVRHSPLAGAERFAEEEKERTAIPSSQFKIVYVANHMSYLGMRLVSISLGS